MTNIKRKTKQHDMQMHIDKAFEIIDTHLPSNYVDLVLSKLSSSKKVSKGVIRNIRNRTAKYPKNISVINALVEVAIDYKNDVEKLQSITQ